MQRIKWYGPSVLLVVTIVAVMLLGPGVAREIAWAQSDAKIRQAKEVLTKSSTLAELSAAYRAVAEAVEPSVVHIQVSARRRPHLDEGPLGRFFGPHGDQQAPGDDDEPDDTQHEPEVEKYNVPHPYGSGSGWVYDNDGHIVTNNHVVDGADEITVRFHDETEMKATVVATDPNTDVAVLKVEGGHLHPAAISDQPVEQGDIVFAFGSPFRFEFSMSQGIVSGIGRNINILGHFGYEFFIQTDAAINPGNSGGPLCNVEGQVVGMNSAIASQSGGFNGLGFAIPADLVHDVVRKLIKNGRVIRGYLGIGIQELDPDMAATFGFKGKGVLVSSPEPGGPADKAGLHDGDIITSLNGKPVTTEIELRLMVADIAPGTQVPVEFYRDGKTQAATITVAEQPAKMAGRSPTHLEEAPLKPAPSDAEVLKKLGLEAVVTLTPELANHQGMKFQPGVLIREVRPDSAAEAKGLRSKMLIVGVMRTPVKTVEDLVAALNKADLYRGVRLRVMYGDDMSTYVVLRLPPPLDAP